eukprot:CAMPEP_0170542278 /NCGR_PEP_ID=MMETSP0211-20121228/1756_1 /TAXON_ID=311385 /ORGANISM="Pseudokeronopsis sp., Strain OXSARD2" /LENGTH=65 /DNA_ID=CAMNT_0010845287 /DNA_START=306 /DNA_END=500 /DNA_ORIENTATION=-
MSGEVSSLRHEPFDDSVESAALIVKWDTSLPNTFLSCAKGSEVLRGCRGIFKQTKHYLANDFFSN